MTSQNSIERAYTIALADVWVGGVTDQPGGLSAKLEGLARAGEELDFMLAMRNLDMPGTGVLLASPLKGAPLVQGRGHLSLWTTMHALRIQGPDRPGLGVEITRAVADLDISVRGA